MAMTREWHVTDALLADYVGGRLDALRSASLEHHVDGEVVEEQRRDDLVEGVDRDGVRIEDAHRGEVEQDPAVGADRDSCVPRRLHDRRHPARRTPRDEDDGYAAIPCGCEGLAGERAHRAVVADQRAVEVARQETDSGREPAPVPRGRHHPPILAHRPHPDDPTHPP